MSSPAPRSNALRPFPYVLERGSARLHDDWRGLLRHTDTEAFCEAVEDVTNTQASRSQLAGFPWLTPVIGPGCLELDDRPGFGAEELADAIGRQLEDVEWPAGIPSPSTLAADFGRSLHRARMHTHGVGAEADAGKVHVHPIAARLTLAAAGLTRLYHEAQVTTGGAFDRWWAQEVIQIDLLSARVEIRRLVTSLIEPLRRELDALEVAIGGDAGREAFATDRDDGQVIQTAVKGLVSAARTNLFEGGGTARIALEQVRLLTEVAWLALIRRTNVYPGWSDLLLSLVIGVSDQEEGRRMGGYRPRVRKQVKVPDAVAGLFLAATVESWESRPDPRSGRAPSSDRDRLFAALARLLQAEADKASTMRDGPVIPPASAFVTSFDLELEMALWDAGRPFRIVLPFHLVDDHVRPRKAELVWLTARICPDHDLTRSQQLDRLRSPGGWQVARLAPRAAGEPVVVHLSGAPLLVVEQTPDRALAAQLGAVGCRVTSDHYLTHAVVVDEYLALRQSQAELYWAINRERMDTDAGRKNLPPELAASTDDIPRFWLALGVQVDDPAIRQRLFSQLSISQIRLHDPQPVDEAGGLSFTDIGLTATDDELAAEASPSVVQVEVEDEEPGEIIDDDEGEFQLEIRGLAVNMRLDADEAAVFAWLGFGVVRNESVKHFADRVAHYADHVDAVDLAGAGRPNRACRLKPQASRST